MTKNLTWYGAGVIGIIILSFFLSHVFSGRLILPQTIPISFLTVRYYGLCMALAVLAGYALARSRTDEYGISYSEADDIMFWLIIGGFIGARFYHVFSSFNYYEQYPLQSLEVWKGGLSIYGALFGGLIALWIYKKTSHFKIKYLTILDWLAPSLLVGQIIGRFGNFFNYELFGYPTNLPWKMFVPSIFRPDNYIGYSFFHPLFLYEALGNVIIVMVLLKYFKKPVPGTLFFTYVLLYNCLRFALEFIRIDSVFYASFRVNAGVSAVLVIFSAAFLLHSFFLKNRNDQIS